MKEQKQILSVKETVKLLSVTKQTLRNWERENILTPKRLGNRVFYLLEDINIALNIKK